MPFPTSLSLLPLLVPLLSVPAVPLDGAPTGEGLATLATAPVTSVRRRPVHRQPPSGCEDPGSPAYDAVAIGQVNRGRLSQGRFVGESEIIRHVDAHDCNFWGTTELAGAIERVAASIAADHPGARLTIGELSRREGGEIAGHASHENGLDVDLGFYWLDERGRAYEPGRFVNVRRDKTTRVGGRTLTFDTARNWKIIEGFLTDPEADLNIVIVHPRIRRWLLTHARTHGVDRELRRRAAIVLRRPNRGSHPHLNHFHLRIYCPESAGRCEDKNALYDWVARARATEESESVASRSSASPTEGESSGPGASPSITNTGTGRTRS